MGGVSMVREGARKRLNENEEEEEEEEQEEEERRRWWEKSVFRGSTCLVHLARYTALSFSFPPLSICATSSGDHCVWRELVVRVVHATSRAKLLPNPLVPRPNFLHLVRVHAGRQSSIHSHASRMSWSQGHTFRMSPKTERASSERRWSRRASSHLRHGDALALVLELSMDPAARQAAVCPKVKAYLTWALRIEFEGFPSASAVAVSLRGFLSAGPRHRCGPQHFALFRQHKRADGGRQAAHLQGQGRHVTFSVQFAHSLPPEALPKARSLATNLSCC
jgi:hypothetical protein